MCDGLGLNAAPKGPTISKTIPLVQYVQYLTRKPFQAQRKYASNGIIPPPPPRGFGPRPSPSSPTGTCFEKGKRRAKKHTAPESFRPPIAPPNSFDLMDWVAHQNLPGYVAEDRFSPMESGLPNLAPEDSEKDTTQNDSASGPGPRTRSAGALAPDDVKGIPPPKRRPKTVLSKNQIHLRSKKISKKYASIAQKKLLLRSRRGRPKLMKKLRIDVTETPVQDGGEYDFEDENLEPPPPPSPRLLRSAPTEKKEPVIQTFKPYQRVKEAQSQLAESKKKGLAPENKYLPRALARLGFPEPRKNRPSVSAHSRLIKSKLKSKTNKEDEEQPGPPSSSQSTPRVSPKGPSSRPPRRTKERAATYLKLLGRAEVEPSPDDDDDWTTEAWSELTERAPVLGNGSADGGLVEPFPETETPSPPLLLSPEDTSPTPQRRKAPHLFPNSPTILPEPKTSDTKKNSETNQASTSSAKEKPTTVVKTKKTKKLVSKRFQSESSAPRELTAAQKLVIEYQKERLIRDATEQILKKNKKPLAKSSSTSQFDKLKRSAKLQKDADRAVAEIELEHAGDSWLSEEEKKALISSDTRSLDGSSVLNYVYIPQSLVEKFSIPSPTPLKPSLDQMTKPVEYFEDEGRKSNYGVLHIHPPKYSAAEMRFSPNEDVRFRAHEQYIHKLYMRHGPSVRETLAIRRLLPSAEQAKDPPKVGNVQVDLPLLFKSIRSAGGFNSLHNKNNWGKVAASMNITPNAHDKCSKLENIYLSYILAYDACSEDERAEELRKIDQEFSRLEKSFRDGGEDLNDWLECVVRGKTISLNEFSRIARNVQFLQFRSSSPSVSQVEDAYFSVLTKRDKHVVVNIGSLDCGDFNIGFPTKGVHPAVRCPWNLKNIAHSPDSKLRSLGSVMNVTNPTLHFGMMFSTSCLYKDPHSLPWVEYHHGGAPKIWYSIPSSQEGKLRSLIQNLSPNLFPDSTSPLWLKSDTIMVPLEELRRAGIQFCRIVQHPGEMVVILPGTFISSVSTGFGVTESVYFAPKKWLHDVAERAFEILHDCREPSLFGWDQLLFSIAEDPSSTDEDINIIFPKLCRVIDNELTYRARLERREVFSASGTFASPSSGNTAHGEADAWEWECEKCNKTLFLGRVLRKRPGLRQITCTFHASENLDTRAWRRTSELEFQVFKTNAEMGTLVRKLSVKDIHSIQAEEE
ncbi:unnamed protein product [Cyprideis torosa]|uniref:Uncharacterized protein n=1 Tax=Cyprideis torosa TaxID=163714 RepID=A0A7R8WE70_9CRUS|nr:unnamed protein product [Cyprideis torosa]CAG0889406.1 unnamed protein product [Cyprideis torosa]